MAVQVKRSERGAALIVVLLLVGALLAGGALAMSMSLGETRAVDVVATRRRALFCAEAGLASARGHVASQSHQWATMLDSDPANDPVGYPVTGDLDDDGVDDWHVEIRDNDDERPDNDPTTDHDGLVFMVATCTSHPETPVEVLQLISVTAGSFSYRNQQGQGASNASNAN